MNHLLPILATAFSMHVVAQPVSEDLTLQVATHEIATLTSHYLIKEQSCQDSTGILQRSDLHSYTLSNEQIKIILTYHSVKSRFDCSRQERSALIASLLAAQHYPDDKASDRIQDYTLIIDDFIHDQHRLWQLTSEYLIKIPTDTREELMSSKKLQEPFRLMESVKALGLD